MIKKYISQFTSHDVNFRCRCPAHSQAFSGPLYIGQNGKHLQTSTAPSTDYAFEVGTPYFINGLVLGKRGSYHAKIVVRVGAEGAAALTVYTKNA